MITPQKALKRATARIVSVSAALGIALAAGAATAATAAAAPASPVKSMAAAGGHDHGHHGGGDDGCVGLLVLICN
ncbi:hypothetical protein ACIBU0_40465 [Streptomyces sp. NPDC049627]|uniref:hypothetical protein n=1 Tax=Streptomyces sp. NPDC049627 TaxID=3365595 RepID=UPI0037AD9A6D